MPEPLLTRFLQPLLAGRRRECLDLLKAAANPDSAEHLLCEVVWPAMGQLQRLYNDDHINAATYNMATLICHTATGQLQTVLPHESANRKRVLICAAQRRSEELGAELITSLFESNGWDAWLIGGGLPYDEVCQLIGQLDPHLLVIFGTEPAEIPPIRALISRIREIGLCPTMNVLVSGGVFNRADGLWEEVGADVQASEARQLIEQANALEPRVPSAPKLGIVKRRRRRRKAPAETAASAPTPQPV